MIGKVCCEYLKKRISYVGSRRKWQLMVPDFSEPTSEE